MSVFLSLLVSFLVGFGEAHASSPNPQDCEPLLKSARVPMAYAFTFYRPIQTRGRTVSGTYRFYEMPNGKFIDVDGFFGQKNRPGLKSLFAVFQSMDPTIPLLSTEWRKIGLFRVPLVADSTPDFSSDESVPLSADSFVRRLWKTEVRWKNLDFLPAGERSLLKLAPEAVGPVDAKLMEMISAYEFRTLPFADNLVSKKSLIEFFEGAWTHAADEIQQLANSTPHINNEFGVSAVQILRKARKTIRRRKGFYERLIRQLPEDHVFNLQNLSPLEIKLIQELRTPIAAHLKEIRVALRVNDLLAVNKSVARAIDEGLIPAANFDLKDLERELDVISLNAIYEVKSSAPMAERSIYNCASSAETVRTIKNKKVERVERQKVAHERVCETINEAPPPVEEKVNGADEADRVEERPVKRLDLDANRPINYLRVYVDGYVVESYQNVPSGTLGLINSSGRILNLRP